ncbi:hypothetical protein NQZ68_014768 [Dissostichus eleginoides]|nr:hypothetical protein NQZ68_014768 [Dissostichus eleginoides]
MELLSISFSQPLIGTHLKERWRHSSEFPSFEAADPGQPALVFMYNRRFESGALIRCIFSGMRMCRVVRESLGSAGWKWAYMPNIRHPRWKAGPFVSEELTSCRSHLVPGLPPQNQITCENVLRGEERRDGRGFALPEGGWPPLEGEEI